jgi:hypothetical protein
MFVHTPTYYGIYFAGLVAAQKARSELPVRPLQLIFENNANREWPNDQTQNKQPRTDGTPHSPTPLFLIDARDSEFIDDLIIKSSGE